MTIACVAAIDLQATFDVDSKDQTIQKLAMDRSRPRRTLAEEMHVMNSRRSCLLALGFTLLELLVVLVILGLLAGYVAPKYFAQVGKSEAKVARSQLQAIEKALDMYRLDTGRLPTSEEGLAALVMRPARETKWGGPYLKKAAPLDPWGKPYIFKSPGEHDEYDLYSLGKDGRPGGDGENADVANW